MKIRLISFNIYLLLISLLIAGCETTEPSDKKTPAKAKKKELTAEEKQAEKRAKNERATIRFHLETNLDGTQKTKVVQIYRANPVNITVEEAWYLDEGYVEKAAVVQWQGAYAIQIEFNHQGAFHLDTLTTSNKGKRLAIFTQFGQANEPAQGRWLGAPIIERRNESGVIVFTPDATREEAERIVNGLNNVVKIIKKRSNLSS